ncbi:L,D-transpeptidase [Nocardioides sp. KC13]|uniref:L,D-transpeptidase n=1 Tax=Nocardioides turkmenicus TaxID=2711220 RepID=A0A6M1R5N1_9ACTN|nr:L,D-transpeptidase [Nocardioides sp. KC13]NGN95604.1 L,D-transpeptidase [Nocardioides sp. KC13]
MLFVASLLTSAGLYGGIEVVVESEANGKPSAADSREKQGADDEARTPVWPHDAQREAGINRHVDARMAAAEKALPADSGTGRRAVFSISRQRVWIVSAAGETRRTYPVSGSIYDNLQPGTYKVFSRSKHARGINDSGTMMWFVRFTKGPNAAIGFHNIPVDKGKRVQTRAQLGTPLSHGCIRQAEPDAKAMWRFARLGTKVVVTR